MKSKALRAFFEYIEWFESTGDAIGRFSAVIKTAFNIVQTICRMVNGDLV